MLAPNDLPPPLPEATVVALNSPDGTLHTTRAYRWNDLHFTVPPGVFRPGLTSAMIFDRLLSGEIETRGRRYLAMGCGLGVEVVAAGLRGAAHSYAVDVHPASVETAVRHFEKHVGPGCTGIVSDVLSGVDTPVDVITFNPPAVSRPVADDPDVVRNVCVGLPLLERFFAQVGGVLAPGGAAYVIASNTSDLPALVRAAQERGLTAELVHVHDWNDGVLTHLFRFTEAGR